MKIEFVIRRMTASDLDRVLAIAQDLPQAPHWPQSAYLKAIDSESTPRRIALVVAGSQPDSVFGFAIASLLPRRPSWKPLPWPRKASGMAWASFFFRHCPPNSRSQAWTISCLKCAPRTGLRWLFTGQSASSRPVSARAIMQIRLKMRSSCTFRPLTDFHERRSIRPDSVITANAASTAISPAEIHRLPLPSVILLLAHSTFLAIYVNVLRKLANSADSPN